MTQLLGPSLTKPALAVLGVLAFCYFVVRSILLYRKRRHIPGPRLAALSELWLFNATAKGDLYLSGEQVLRKYGRLS